MTKFMPGPANSTATRFHTFCRNIAYGCVLGREFLDRRHARDVAEAAERDGLDAVLGVAELVGAHGRPQRRTEADEVATHLHSGGARHPHVTAFVQGHRDQNGQCEQHNAQYEHHLVGTTSCATARLRPVPGPVLRVEYVVHGSRFRRPLVGSAQHLGDVRTIAGNRIRPSRNAAAASSLAAL